MHVCPLLLMVHVLSLVLPGRVGQSPLVSGLPNVSVSQALLELVHYPQRAPQTEQVGHCPHTHTNQIQMQLIYSRHMAIRQKANKINNWHKATMHVKAA